MTTEVQKPQFLYDDCCPLCRGYTATFSALGWADRAAFSTIGDDTLQALDLNTARHHIPLHDPSGAETKYGLDGILDIVATEAPRLGAIGNHRMMRPVLDRLYWFITYNRRHIVAAAPPAEGFDCAPDYEARAVATYVGFCTVAATALAATTSPLAVGVAAASAGAFVANRDEGWEINDREAAGHAGSVAVAAGIAGLAAKAVTARPDVTALTIAATAARKLYLRRWMSKAAPGSK